MFFYKNNLKHIFISLLRDYNFSNFLYNIYLEYIF